MVGVPGGPGETFLDGQDHEGHSCSAEAQKHDAYGQRCLVALTPIMASTNVVTARNIAAVPARDETPPSAPSSVPGLGGQPRHGRPRRRTALSADASASTGPRGLTPGAE